VRRKDSTSEEEGQQKEKEKQGKWGGRTKVRKTCCFWGRHDGGR
jgi:hypothetical protein